MISIRVSPLAVARPLAALTLLAALAAPRVVHGQSDAQKHEAKEHSDKAAPILRRRQVRRGDRGVPGPGRVPAHRRFPTCCTTSASATGLTDRPRKRVSLLSQIPPARPAAAPQNRPDVEAKIRRAGEDHRGSHSAPPPAPPGTTAPPATTAPAATAEPAPRVLRSRRLRRLRRLPSRSSLRLPSRPSRRPSR